MSLILNIFQLLDDDSINMDNHSGTSDDEDIFDEVDEDDEEAATPKAKQTNGNQSDSDEEMDYSD